jgi:hypothetical protein
MAGRPPLELGDQFAIQVADMQISSHAALFEIIEINDLKRRRSGQ